MLSTLALAALALLPQSKGEDVLILNDGRMLDQLKVEMAEGGYLLRFNNGEVFVPEDLVREAVVAGEEFVPVTEEEKAQFERGKVPFEGKWVSASKRTKEIEKRLKAKRAMLEDYRSHQLWRNRYQEETKHFEFEHTVPPHVFERYRDLMEAYFRSFCKDWKVKQPKDLGKLKVCFYADEELFWQVSSAGPGVLGYFRFVDPLELNFFYERLAPAFTEEVMFHEANHYLQKLIRPDFSYPHFPGESVAEFYGASRYDHEKDKIESGLILNGRLTEVMTDISGGEWMPLEKLVSTSRLYEHYTWGWTLVHFLMNDKRYEDRFRKFMRGLAFDKKVKREQMGLGLETVSGEEVFRAFKTYLKIKSDEELAQLEKEWHAYIQDELHLEGSSGLEEAAFAASKTGRPIRARRLFQEAIDAGSASAMAHNRYAELLLQEDDYEQAVANWTEASQLDPVAGRYYAARGRALIRWDKKKNLEEGRRLIRLALELDPDDAAVRSAAKRYLD